MIADIQGSGFTTLAALDFSTEDGYAVFSRYLADEVSAALHSSDTVRLIERENLAKVIEEQQFQVSGEVSDETAKSLGKIIGVDMLLFGRITDLPSSVLVSCRVIAVETGALLSIANREFEKTVRLTAFLERKGSAGTARPAPASAAPGKTVAAPAPAAQEPVENRPVLDIGDNDLETEAGQVTALREFLPFVIDNLLKVNITGLDAIGNSKAKPDEYQVKVIWEYQEDFAVINTMAGFFRNLPRQQRRSLTQGSGNFVIRYFPSSYAASAETIDIKLFLNAEKYLKGFDLGFHWELEFTIKGSLPGIPQTKPRSRYIHITMNEKLGTQCNLNGLGPFGVLKKKIAERKRLTDLKNAFW